MENDRPTFFELVKALDDYLESLGTSFNGIEKYNLNCAQHILGILEREMQQLKTESFTKLRHHDPDLINNDSLSKKIIAGELDHKWKETVNKVLLETIPKVKVSDPSHLRNKKTESNKNDS